MKRHDKDFSKKKAQHLHAKRRFIERYGLEVNRKDLRFMINQIQNGKAKLIERQSHRVSKWRVKFADRNVYVVYDKMRKSIVTALPADAYQ